MRLRNPKRAAEIVELKDENVKGIEYLRKRGWSKVREDDEEVPAPKKDESGKMTKMPNPGYSLRPVEPQRVSDEMREMAKKAVDDDEAGLTEEELVLDTEGNLLASGPTWPPDDAPVETDQPEVKPRGRKPKNA